MRLSIAFALFCSACSAGSGNTDTWVKPPSETETCEAWAEIRHGSAVYFNNVWNVQAAGDFAWKQCIERDPADPERLGFSWHWPDYGSDIYSQPQVKIGVSPWLPLPKLDDRFPVAIADLDTMTVATGVAVEARGEYNIVTTLWLTDTGEIGDEPQPGSIVAEAMFWTDATDGLIDPAGSKVGTVRHGGRDWDIWLNRDWHDVSGENANRWIYLAFVASPGGPAASFDPVALLRSKELSQLGFERAYIADVELGAEIMRGDGLMWIDRFDVEIQRR